MWSLCLCVYVSVHACTEGCSESREESRTVMSLCLCVFTCTFKHKQWRAHRVVCVCFCVGVEVGGLHQYSAVAPYEECVGGGKGREASSGGCGQGRTVRWVGTKRLDGGLLDWPTQGP